VELELPGRCRAIDALSKADERNADMLQVFEHGDKVPQVASEPVETPAHEHIETSPLGVPNQIIEGGAALLCAARPLIDIFPRNGPTCASTYRLSSKSWFSHV
jgi:hypothetical protein